MALKVCQLCAVDFTLRHFLLPLIDGMSEAGWDVTSVCSDGPHVNEMRARGYRIATIPISRNLNVLSHLVSFWRLFQFFRRERFDVLHAHTPIAALVGRLAARAAGVPLIVYTAHGFYFHDEMPAWKRRLYVLLEWIGGRATDLLFTQSEEDAVAAVAEGICRANIATAIGNGVDPRRFDPQRIADPASVRHALGIPRNARVVGIIGRMVREKGYEEFLAAAIGIARAFPDTYFLLVGGRLASDHDDPIEHALSRAKEVLGDRLVLTGFREDTPEMIAVMDVFCLPSYREGMPRTIIEAMMMAKPVVATNIRGSREEVVEGETGWLVPTKDPKALESALRRCLENPELAVAMGTAGQRRAMEIYDERKVVALQLERIADHLKSNGYSCAISNNWPSSWHAQIGNRLPPGK